MVIKYIQVAYFAANKVLIMHNECIFFTFGPLHATYAQWASNCSVGPRCSDLGCFILETNVPWGDNIL
ncbi:hypothetical protein XENTR_v10010898 [Xenopus tropicalis]|nr:hypothetical protein XENTR_v10010898 [Xenopus tropicalis]